MPKLVVKQPKILAADSETTGLDFHHGAKPFFWTFCDNAGNVTYYQWDVDPLTREPIVPEEDLDEIQQTLDEVDILVLQNGKFDVTALRTLFESKGRVLRWPWHKMRDTLIAGHLLASNQSHDLTTMVLVYCGVNILPLEEAIDEATQEARKIVQREARAEAKDSYEGEIKYRDWLIAKAGLACMPSAKEKTFKIDMWVPRAVAKAEGYEPEHSWFYSLTDYANCDSSTTLPCWLAQENLLKKRGLELIYQERLKLLPIVHDMEWRGVTMSKPRLESLYGKLSKEAEECRQACIKAADGEIEDLPVNGVSNALKHVVFDKFKLESTKKTDTGNPSMDKYVLEHWLATLEEGSKPHTFIKNLRAYRKRKTALSYMDTYQKFWIPSDKARGVYRVFPSLNPTGTDTLRWSSSNPNEQQVSKQDEVNLRYCFGPAPGREWWALDYQNLELRIPAYESGEAELIDLFERGEEPPYYGSTHLLNFSTVYPDIWADAVEKVGLEQAGPYCKKTYASTWYQWCKNGDFAVQYGAMELEDEEGTADRAFHRLGSHAKLKARFAKLEALNQKMIRMAEKLGYVETIPDKTVDPKHGYPLLAGRSRWGKIRPTTPLNYHVQSTACWVAMKAMLRCQEYLNEYNAGVPESKRAYMIIQVHDEIVFDLPAGGKKNLPKVNKLRRLMEASGEDIGIPLRCSVTYHPESWSEEKKL